MEHIIFGALMVSYLKRAVGIVSALILFVPTLAQLRSTSVSAECNPHQVDPNRIDDGQHYWAGAQRNPPSGNVAEKVRATIEVRDVYVQSGEFSTAWTMLTEIGSSPDQYAQTGWMEFPGNARYRFVEWANLPGEWTRRLFPGDPVGSFNTYETRYNAGAPGGPEFEFLVNGSYVYFADTYGYWAPSEYQAYGEVTTLANQMPGGAQYKDHFHSAQVAWGGGGYQSFSGVYHTSQDTYFGSVQVNSQHHHIWDKACSN